MRRALAVLIVGALGFGIGTPAAAGNDPSTKRPEPARLKLACSPVPEADPAVHCEWSEADAGTGYRLWRGGWAGRRVVYRGTETQATDQRVRAGAHYVYRAHAYDASGRVIARSKVVHVRMPSATAGPTRPVKPAPVPVPLPKPQPDPRPRPLPKPDPVPVPSPTPKPRPLPEPEPKPLPLPEPKPAPEPEPKPVPYPEPKPLPAIDLACRASSGTVEPADDRLMRPTLWEGPSVTCKWSMRSADDTTSTRKVAGFRLWKASRNADKQVVFRTDSETAYVDHDVVPGNAYAYMVQAVDAAGNAIAGSAMVKVAV